MSLPTLDLNTYLILFILSIVLIGFVSILQKLFYVTKKYDFSIHFFEKLKVYVESSGRDNETYSWLTSKSSKMQNYIGSFGVMEYRPAYQNYIVHNYQLIINGLSELRTYYDDSLLDSLANQMSQTLQEAIIRYLGSLEDSREFYISQLKNPIIWFREGIRTVLGIPFQSLVWFGILSSITVSKITTNLFFKFISGIIALMTFTGTVITIILGWEEFVKIVFSLF